VRADRPEDAPARRILVLGGTGTIGRATVRALVSRGHAVVCLVRRPAPLPAGATARVADVTDPASLARDGLRGEPFDVLISCLASRTGLPRRTRSICPESDLKKAVGRTIV
jgi:divinyl chlorophyllide a 8-vinyl-reductase